MAIEKMRYVVLSTDQENVIPLIRCVGLQDRFHPELANEVIHEEDGGVLYQKEPIYTNFKTRIDRIEELLNTKFTKGESTPMSDEDIEKKLNEAEALAEKAAVLYMQLSTSNKDEQIAYDAFSKYPIEYDKEGFISYGFGKMPLGNYNRLFEFNQEQFIFTKIHQNRIEAWVLYVCLKSKETHFNQLFESLGFEPVQMHLDNQKLERYDFDVELGGLYAYLETMSRYEQAYKYIAIYDGKATLSGFVPESYLEEFKQGIETVVTIKDFDPSVQEDIETPTLLKNNLFARPFELFVDMYGLPKYTEFDPTTYFAITYSIMFGMMFGDLGQGLMIAIAGWLFAKKTGSKLGEIMIRLGISSMIFGVIYGSVFGNEEIIGEILGPLNIGLPIHVTSPSFTMNLLISTVAFGAILLLSSIALNIVLSLKHKRYQRALFTQNGVAGFVFYAFVLFALVKEVTGSSVLNPLTISLFIGVPIFAMFMKEPLGNLLGGKSVKPHEGWGGYILESFFEMFEVLIGFVSNTMSFMRVGGFVLSHAGMMTVVAVLQQMSGKGAILVLIIGNIFVVCLEGLLVGIQSLRLQYYEIFSRFYDGGGKPFETVK